MISTKLITLNDYIMVQRLRQYVKWGSIPINNNDWTTLLYLSKHNTIEYDSSLANITRYPAPNSDDHVKYLIVHQISPFMLRTVINECVRQHVVPIDIYKNDIAFYKFLYKNRYVQRAVFDKIVLPTIDNDVDILLDTNEHHLVRTFDKPMICMTIGGNVEYHDLSKMFNRYGRRLPMYDLPQDICNLNIFSRPFSESYIMYTKGIDSKRLADELASLSHNFEHNMYLSDWYDLIITRKLVDKCKSGVNVVGMMVENISAQVPTTSHPYAQIDHCRIKTMRARYEWNKMTQTNPINLKAELTKYIRHEPGLFDYHDPIQDILIDSENCMYYSEVEGPEDIQHIITAIL